MRRYLLVGFLCAGLVAACGDDPEEPSNNEPNNGADVGVDADAGPDAQPDARPDAEPDAEPDAQPDDEVGPDADGDGEEQEPNDSLEDANAVVLGGEITGTIEDRGADAFDEDYFRLTLSPGDRVRVEVAADDELQPFIFVGEQFEETIFSVGEARSVDGVAAIEFTLDEDAGEDVDFFVIVTDERNEPVDAEEDPANVGGDTFGYTLTVTEATWTPTDESLPVEVSGSLDNVGVYDWYQFDVTADTLVSVEITTEAEDFSPFSAFLQDDGTAFPNPANTALPIFDDGSAVAGVRDSFFRGGAGYDYDLSIESASFADLTFNEIEEAADNNAIGSAQSLSGDVPVAVEATATGTDIDDLDADYFSVTLDAGQSLGLFTGPGLDDQIDDADTVLFVLDPDGNEIYFNDDYPLAGNFFSAGLITADQAGEYIVVIEPFCNDEGCFEGDYSLFAFTEPGE